MGLFNKKEGKKSADELPELPKFPSLSEEITEDTEEPREEFQEEPREEFQEPAEEPQTDFQEDEQLGEPSITDKPKYSGRETNMLPSFPRSGIGERLNKEAIKSAISRDDEEKEEDYMAPIPPPNFSEPYKPIFKKIDHVIPISEPFHEPPVQRMVSRPMVSTRIQKRVEPVYVRIDKFKLAMNNFQVIQTKVAEIDHLLKNLKEQKRKEDEELKEWEREIELIKERVIGIDQSIFSKLD